MSESGREGHGRRGHRRRRPGRGSGGPEAPGSERDGRHERRSARKERVLHTRISDDLAEDIRRIAEDLRVPVSNIVRTVLEEAFSVVEKVTDDVGDLIEEVLDEAEAARERIRRRQAARRAWRRQRSDGAGWDEDFSSDDASSRTPLREEAPEVAVIGWQPLILAEPRRCARCALPLASGAQAWASVTARDIGGEIRCESCVRDGGRPPDGRPAPASGDGS